MPLGGGAHRPRNVVELVKSAARQAAPVSVPHATLGAQSGGAGGGERQVDNWQAFVPMARGSGDQPEPAAAADRESATTPEVPAATSGHSAADIPPEPADETPPEPGDEMPAEPLDDVPSEADERARALS